MDTFLKEAHKLFGVNLTDRQIDALITLERELLVWNEKFNLTAIRDKTGIQTRHFLDSFSCVLAWKENPPRRLIDIGTGAGFPGFPLKILYPSMQLTLVESVGKKANFCRHIVETLKLDQTEVVTARAEDVGQMSAHRETYDWAVARAVANMSVLAEYLLPLVRVGGAMLAQKGQSGPEETHKAEKAFKLLGGQTHQLLPVVLPGVADERFLIIINKISATPLQYPRKPGIPSKKPL